MWSLKYGMLFFHIVQQENIDQKLQLTFLSVCESHEGKAVAVHTD